MTSTTQITARVPTTLKKQFMLVAKEYGIPTSTLMRMFMKMVIDKKISPELAWADDNQWTPELSSLQQETYHEYQQGETISLDTMMTRLGATA